MSLTSSRSIHGYICRGYEIRSGGQSIVKFAKSMKRAVFEEDNLASQENLRKQSLMEYLRWWLTSNPESIYLLPCTSQAKKSWIRMLVAIEV